jgi:glycosyltransferase involved in cell wall biosynthesis
MRTLRVVRQLHADGWAVTVLTGAPETYLPATPIDAGLKRLVPEGVEVLQVRAIRPLEAMKRWVGRASAVRPAKTTPSGPQRAVAPRRHGWWTRFGSIRALIEAASEIPDKESGWILPAVLRGAWHMLRFGRPDVIYSSAPPWSGQVVALGLSRLSHRPWVADFRDPWARAPWRDWRRAFRQRAVAALERRVVMRADAVLFVTEANRREFSTFYGPLAAGRFQLVPNGCDPTEFEGLPLLVRPGQFVLLHAGTFYGPRSPMPVIEAIARAVGRGALDRQTFRLRLVGPINITVDVPAECARLGLADVVEFVPRLSRADCLREMKSASALLLVQVGTTVSVPGKAYEYLAAGRPVLALSEEGETAALVRASGAGVSLPPGAPVEGIEAALLDIVARAETARSPVAPEFFDGRVHARETVRILSHVARHGRRVPLGRSRVDGDAGGAFPPAAIIARHAEER